MSQIDIFEQENEVQARTFIPQNVDVQQYVGSVEVGNVTTLPAGSQATVENVGDNTHAILDFGLPKGDAGSMWGELAGDLEDQTDLYTILTGLQTAINGKAALASPSLTGTPTAPTAADNTNTTQIATTAFVKNAITNLSNSLQTYIQNYVNIQVGKMLGRINYNGTVTIYDRWYTVPSDGYILAATYTGTGPKNGLDINNKHIIFSSNTAESQDSIPLLPVSAGDVLKPYGGLGANSYVVGSFFPQKTL